MANSQLINLAATPEGLQPTSDSPFPPVGIITPGNLYPASPSPGFYLQSGTVKGVYPVVDTLYPAANSAIFVQYWAGNMIRTEKILATQTAAAINTALNA